jgi:hypothetical protein
VTNDYFNDRMLNRQRLLWAIATRRQLERWEPLVASHLRVLLADGEPEGTDIWSAEIEHHFALVAARNLVRALELPPATSVSVDPTLRDELIEGRDLHEHWPDNMPVFNVTPRPAQPPLPLRQALRRSKPQARAILVARLDQQNGRSAPAERLGTCAA